MNEVTQHSFQDSLGEQVLESFSRESSSAMREVRFGDGQSYTTSIDLANTGLPARTEAFASENYYASWLRSTSRPPLRLKNGSLSVVDLFAGCGGLTLGISEAARSIGLEDKHSFASELNNEIAQVFKSNFKPNEMHVGDIADVFSGRLGEKLSARELQVKEKLKRTDILCGGPPCQGHSDLNNYTRRDDPRNSLYFIMARAAEVIGPKCILIENVPGVVRDRTGSFKSTISALEHLGYHVAIKTLNACNFGVPQSRKRTFIFAARCARQVEIWVSTVDQFSEQSTRNVLWAISDLQQIEPNKEFDEPSKLSAESKMRVNWLFENQKFELPDEFRPSCHRLKTHSYKSVYGRMYPDRVAPTITTGFLVMGQGRFLHPVQPRTITPHEGARLQTFPDFFNFGSPKRTMFARMIGNAVPPLLAYYVGLAAVHAISNQIQ